jgi:hypothetical protein
MVNVRKKGSIDDSGGLLGTDIFKRFLVKVDFANHRVDLDPLFGPPWDGYTPVDRYAGPEMDRFLPIVQTRHYLLMPVAVSEQEKSDRVISMFLVDAGAGFDSISTGLARSLTSVRYNRHMSVKGVSGKVKMLYEAEWVYLRVAGFERQLSNMAAFDLSSLSHSAGLEIGGILGMPILSTFQSFTIDYRDAGIRFDH